LSSTDGCRRGPEKTGSGARSEAGIVTRERDVGRLEQKKSKEEERKRYRMTAMGKRGIKKAQFFAERRSQRKRVHSQEKRPRSAIEVYRERSGSEERGVSGGEACRL